MTKLSKIIAGIVFVLFLTISVKTVLASEEVSIETIQNQANQQNCTPQVFEVDADEDNDTHFDLSETGGKVEITFNDTDGTAPSEDDRDQVIVTVGAGYEIVNVQYELEHYSGIGWTTVPGNNPTTTITLAGIDDDSRIDEVEVKLQTICATPTPTLTDTPTPTPTNQPSNPSNNSGNNNGGGSSSNTSSQPANTPAVLGASTMATTGNFSSILMNLYTIFGMLLVWAGYVSYAKEKKII